MKRYLSLLMALLLGFSIIYANPQLAVAEEQPATENEPEAGEETPTGGESSVSGGEKATYKLVASTDSITFDPIEEGSAVRDKDIIITNKGAAKVKINWSVSGDSCFTIASPKSTEVEAEKSAIFEVNVADGTTEGDYAGSVTFWSEQDTAKTSVVTVKYQIKVSKKQEEKKPVVESVTISPSSQVVEKGQTAKFTATVNGSYLTDTTVRWSVKGNTSSDTDITSNGKLTVASNEGASSLTITAISNQDGSKYANAEVSLNEKNVYVQLTSSGDGQVSGGGYYKKGSTVELKASANNGYTFAGWYSGDKQVCSTTIYQIKDIQNDVSVKAVFNQTLVKISTNVNPAGAGTVTDTSTVTPGSDKVLEAKTYNGYVFLGWTDNATGKTLSNDAKFTLQNVTKDTSVTAQFAKSSYTIQTSVYPANSGTVTGGGIYALNTSVTLTATPANGYKFTGWYLNNALLSTSTTYKIPKVQMDACIIAGFAKSDTVNYTIVSSVNGVGGIISPSGNVSVPKGTAVTFTITPNNGYQVASVKVDGKAAGTNNQYTFNNVTGNHTLVVSFAQISTKKSESKTSTTDKTKTSTNTNKSSTSTNKSSTTSSTDKSRSSSSTTNSGKTETIKTGDQASGKSSGSTTSPFAVDATVDSGLTSDLDQSDAIVEVLDDAEHANSSSGVLAEYSVTRDEAKQMYENGTSTPLFASAMDEGYLSFTVNNSYSPQTQATADNSFYSNPSVTNYDEVMQSVLTEDELLDSLEGTPTAINVDITSYTDDLEWYYKDAVNNIADYYNLNTVEYFEINMLKSIAGDTTSVTDFNGTNAKFTLELPDSLKGKTVSVVHLHKNAEGKIEQSLLKDLDDDPDTITFETSKLSLFAFAVENSTAKTSFLLVLTAGFAVGVGSVVALLGITAHANRVKRRKHRAEAKSKHVD